MHEYIRRVAPLSSGSARHCSRNVSELLWMTSMEEEEEEKEKEDQYLARV